MRNGICLTLMGMAMAVVATGALAQASAPVAAGELPPGSGKEITEQICSACHSPIVITHQRLSHDDWADLVYQMADRGALASDEELTQIIDYLSQSFPPEEGAH